MNQSDQPFLVSNSFPFALMRRRVLIEPRTMDSLRLALRERSWVSAWGHPNTVAFASEAVGADLTPAVERPKLDLSPEHLPRLDGASFNECWILSIIPVPGLRRDQQRDLQPAQIQGWQILQLLWLDSETPTADTRPTRS